MLLTYGAAMNADFDEPVSATAFADLVGVTQQAISQRVNDGLLVPGQPLREWLRAYCGKLRDEAAGRGGEDQASLTRARTRDAEASAELKLIQIKEKAGQLVAIDDIEPGISAMITAARQELLTLPDQLVDEILALYDLEIDPSLITERIHYALEHLAGGRREDGAGHVVTADEVVGPAAQDDDH